MAIQRIVFPVVPGMDVPSCRLSVIGSLVLVLVCAACGEESLTSSQHRAVGDWYASDGSYVLHLFPDGSGAFDTRGCEWKVIDEFRVKTDCERAVRDRAVLVFSVQEEQDKVTGTLESYPETVFVRRVPRAERSAKEPE
jgi:hypothetical protein